MDLVKKIFDKHGIGIVYLKEISLADNFQLNYMLALYGDEEWMRAAKHTGFPAQNLKRRLIFAWQIN